MRELRYMGVRLPPAEKSGENKRLLHKGSLIPISSIAKKSFNEKERERLTKLYTFKVIYILLDMKRKGKKKAGRNKCL